MRRFGWFGGVFAVALAISGACVPNPEALPDSCQFAHDSECDEERYGGTGACRPGTDTSDCAFAVSGDNTCGFAFNGECDEPEMGTGRCSAGTDTRDCRPLLAGGDDSCRAALNGRCDEAGIGLGICADGTDATDCRAVYDRRNRSNLCASAFDGVCDEPGGTGHCEARTDTVDCLGRGTPTALRDHYHGTDDRIPLAPDRLPWSAIGVLVFPDGQCTGVLVAPRIVLTAAHCFYGSDDRRIEPSAFLAGLSGETWLAGSAIERSRVSTEYRPGGARSMGNDWGMAVLERPIGNRVGTVAIRELTTEDLVLVAAGAFPQVVQAGYPWDSPSRLIGHLGCRIAEARDDDSFLHECDTTYGDSGSPLMVEGEGGRYHVIGIESRAFTDDDGRHSTNVAVDSRAFAEAVADLAASMP